MLITKKCPVCMADIQFDSSKEFMFCQYCGVKIMNENYKAPAAPQTPDFATAPPKNTSVNSANPNNQAQNINFATAPPVTKPADVNIPTDGNNVFITFKTINLRYRLQTSIDNRMITQYSNGDCIGFALTVGKHFVKFRLGSKRYMRPIMITDANSKVYINYLFDGVNHIDITF